MSAKTGQKKKTKDHMILDSRVTFHQLAMIRELLKNEGYPRLCSDIMLKIIVVVSVVPLYPSGWTRITKFSVVILKIKRKLQYFPIL